ncbi:MAG TPA: polyprenyl synthetase family protein [Spirochaetota bacterium]|nr:polyprenyl synthetase family protein [Spirochaetota bacterium]HPV41822.1 polyprenyl synthetase family protein [Spirochaetota bacterium]
MKQSTTPISRFREFSKQYIPLIDSSMEEFFKNKIRDAEIPEIRDMYAYLSEYCLRDGKRVRPLVLLASCCGYGSAWNREDIVRMASVLEMIHSFLLIQDDIIDRSPLRRGGRSLHLVCGDCFSKRSHNESIGSDIALILGDVLFANAIEIMADTGVSHRLKNRFMKLVASTLEITAWGQTLDILHSASRTIDSPRETATRIAMMKTAYYTIYYPMLMGYALAGKDSPKEKERIRAFALPLGQAFQIRDDILGVFGKEDATGKSADSDIMEGKITLLVSGAIESLRGKDLDLFLSLFTKKNKQKRDIAAIRKLIQRSGSLDSAKERHWEFVEQSRWRLADLAVSSEYHDILHGLVDLVAVV